MTTKKSELVLNSQEIRDLKGKLHSIKPTVVVDSKGLTEELFQEIEHALNSAELIKIRTHAENTEELVNIAEAVCSKVKAVLIQTIGSIIAVYRKNLAEE